MVRALDLYRTEALAAPGLTRLHLPPTGGEIPEDPDRGSERVAAVVIGKDEGNTLRACLDRCREQCGTVIYVDSGSSDNSVSEAGLRGAHVVQLGSIVPFLPGLARNAGFRQLEQRDSDAEFVHFVDGDCVLEPDWVARAVAALDADPSLQVVCGHLLEVDAQSSPWKRMCQIEWAEPTGRVSWCGGIFIVRREVFRAVEGFREDMTAGEEPDLCTRIRDMGGAIERIDTPMAHHNSHMYRFSEWWQREVRGGYMDFSVAAPSGEQPFARERFRMYAWTLGWLALCAVLTLVAGWIGGLLGLCILPLQMLRQMRWCLRQGHDRSSSLIYGVLVVLLNWPKLLGQLRFRWDRRRLSSESPNFFGRPPT